MDNFKEIFSKILNVSVFGWLDRIPVWNALPYQWKGAILRALKAALSGVIGVALTIPLVGLNPLVVVIIASGLQGLDKAVREWRIDQDLSAANAIPATSSNVSPETPVNTDATAITANPSTGEPELNTDATVVEDNANPDPTEFDDPPDGV